MGVFVQVPEFPGVLALRKDCWWWRVHITLVSLDWVRLVNINNVDCVAVLIKRQDCNFI